MGISLHLLIYQQTGMAHFKQSAAFTLVKTISTKAFPETL